MVLEKNTELYPDLCAYYIKSVRGIADFPLFSKIYATPSSIKWKKTEKETSAGILYTHTLSALYPGLSKTDFPDFHKMIKDRFQLQTEMLNADVYLLSGPLYPFKMSYKFLQQKGCQFTFKAITPFETIFKYNLNTSNPADIHVFEPGVAEPNVSE